MTIFIQVITHCHIVTRGFVHVSASQLHYAVQLTYQDQLTLGNKMVIYNNGVFANKLLKQNRVVSIPIFKDLDSKVMGALFSSTGHHALIQMKFNY